MDIETTNVPAAGHVRQEQRGGPLGLRWALAAGLLAWAGCAPSSPPAIDPGPGPAAKIDTDFARLPKALAGITKSAAVTYYEGLPSVFWEPELLQSELKSQSTIALHGYRFYQTPIEVSGPEADRLTELFASKSTYQRYKGPKRCGGYHPETCLEWKTGERATQALVCLECGEVKMFGPSTELLCDLSRQAQSRLEPLLGPYQKNKSRLDASPKE